MHQAAAFPQIDHAGTVCARCFPNGISNANRRDSPPTRAQRRSRAVRDRAAVALCQPVSGGAGRADRHSPGRSHRADEIPGTPGIIVLLNALMGLPPVVVGLAVYLALSRSGPLGAFGLLFTPRAMIIAQTVLVAPIIAALTRQTIEDLWLEYRDELTAMNLGPL